jgi:hypothetical protein
MITAQGISHPLIWLDYLEDQGVDTVSTRAWALLGFSVAGDEYGYLDVYVDGYGFGYGYGYGYCYGYG